jgi:hypothetical protein
MIILIQIIHLHHLHRLHKITMITGQILGMSTTTEIKVTETGITRVLGHITATIMKQEDIQMEESKVEEAKIVMMMTKGEKIVGTIMGEVKAEGIKMEGIMTVEILAVGVMVVEIMTKGMAETIATT